jgi:pilus assembly protein CpaF
MAGVDLPERAIREQISSAIHLFVQISRLQDGSRRCIYVTEVQGMEGNMITLQDIFLFEQLGLNEDGKVRGVLKGMGIIPKHMTRLKAHGENLPPEVFSTKVEVP